MAIFQHIRKSLDVTNFHVQFVHLPSGEPLVHLPLNLYWNKKEALLSLIRISSIDWSELIRSKYNFNEYYIAESK